MFHHGDKARIFDINDRDPPTVVYSVSITKDFSVAAFNGFTEVGAADLLGFARKLCKWSQLDEVLNRTKHASPAFTSELDGLLARLDELADLLDVDNASYGFLSEQLRQVFVAANGRRYSSNLINTAVELFISSRSAYRTASQYLALPSPRTLYQHIGRICDIGQDSECDRTIGTVMQHLNGLQRECIILFDEMYVKPSIRYRGGHLFGHAVDAPNQVARTILAIMIRCVT